MMEMGKIVFKIVGILTSEEFQKCKFYAEYLHKYIPDEFAPPVFRPMLDVQWTEFLTQHRRDFVLPFWMLQVPVAVFQNEEFFGNDSDFVKYCMSNIDIYVNNDFQKCGLKQLQKTLDKSQRAYVYFTISIDGSTVGKLFFEVYTDLVPITCANFLRLCRTKSHHGYKKSPIHRIAKSSWIQVGGFNLNGHNMPCENYIVPHDQRGVLSMCNNGKHKGNSTQFFVTLNSTPWMDYYYVAFGKLIHGEEVLKKIETTPTKYESPIAPIIIEKCGEFTSDNKEILGDFKTSRADIYLCNAEYECEELHNSLQFVDQRSMINSSDDINLFTHNRPLSVNNY